MNLGCRPNAQRLKITRTKKMKFRIVLPLLLCLPIAASAQRTPYLIGFTGLEVVRSDDFTDALMSVGLEIQANRHIAVQLSLGFQDDDIRDRFEPKGDMYVKYRFAPGSTIEPYVSSGLTIVGFNQRQCSKQRTIGDPPVVQMACYTSSSRSSGLSYQVGASIEIKQNTKLNLFFGQFFGSKDLQMNTIGINVSLSP